MMMKLLKLLRLWPPFDTANDFATSDPIRITYRVPSAVSIAYGVPGTTQIKYAVPSAVSIVYDPETQE